jgi:hypothetical protein
MLVSRFHIPTALALVMGLIIGLALASLRPMSLHAGAGDRSGESIVATGPVLVRYDEAAKGPIALDAVYFLDYKGGRLLAAVPSYQQTNTSTHLIESFNERDLVADFKLDLEAGPRPRFLMTTGSLGPYNDGWAPLYVFETNTNQMAIYRMKVQLTIGKTSRPRFDLVEVRSFAKTAAANPTPSAL